MALLHNRNTFGVRLAGKLVWNIGPGETKAVGEAFASLPSGVEVVKAKREPKPKKAAKKAAKTSTAKTSFFKKDEPVVIEENTVSEETDE